MGRLLLGLLLAVAVGVAPAAAGDQAAVKGGAEEPGVERVTRSYHPKFFLSYSPDGTHLVYSRHHANRRGSGGVLVQMRAVKADGTEDRALLSAFERDVQIQEHGAFSPDGKRLLLTGGGNDLGNAAKDTFVCEIDGEFKASGLKKLVPGSGIQVGEQPAWAPDGKQIVVATTSGALFVRDADGSKPRKLVQAGGTYLLQPAWSPDGKWIAFASDRDGNCEIYKIRPDGSGLVRLTQHEGIDCRPKWSPDGRWIAFASNRSGNMDVWLMREDGREPRALTRHPATDDHPAWSPDGKAVAFVSMRDGGFDVYRMRVGTEVGVTGR